jgi:uncharacterized protein YbcI
MAVSEPRSQPSLLLSVSNALVGLHKEQFGRGPAAARANFAGPDALMCILEDALLPAERTLVELGEAQRMSESRLLMQNAAHDRFVERVEEITGRKVRSFSSACDPQTAVVIEIFLFEPQTRPTIAEPR